jgi:hypothetical protein
MRTLILPFLLLSISAAWSVEALIPEAMPVSRYEKMTELSPFALATAAPAAEAPKETFTANWTLTGLAKMQDKQGVERTFVTVKSRDQRISFSLFGDQVLKDKDPDIDGVSISSVDWKPGPRKSSVMLKKGSEIGKIEFGQDSAPPPAAPANNTRPGNPGTGMGRPPTVPGRPALPRPNLPNANPIMPTPGNSIVPGQPNNAQRRVRVLPPPPQPQ